MKVIEFIKIIRPIDCIIAALGAFIGFSLSIQGIAFNELILYAMLAVFFVCAGGQTINDYFDYAITKKQALIYSISLFLIGIIFSFFINLIAFIAAMFFVLLLVSYSALMKKIKYFGNFVVSFSVAFTILFGAIISMNFFLPLILFVSAFFANTSREIIKDLEDLKTEQGIKITLPQLLPKKVVEGIIALFYVIAILVGFYPFFTGLFNSLPYLLLMIFSTIFFALSLIELFKKDFSCSQNHSKKAMFLGLIAFLFAVI